MKNNAKNKVKSIVRITEIRLHNFKNTVFGTITVPSRSNIVGIYGQNGSGKTAVVEALDVVQRLLTREGLRDVPIKDYIRQGENRCSIRVCFQVELEDEKQKRIRYAVTYDVVFHRGENGSWKKEESMQLDKVAHEKHKADIIDALLEFFFSNLSVEKAPDPFVDIPETVSVPDYHLLNHFFCIANAILSRMIPGLSLGIRHFEEKTDQNGEKRIRIEPLSERDGIVIPLHCESEGILNLVGLLFSLVRVYNDPSACLVVDNLDAGISEYLLGELVAAFGDFGKGQLIFTSHNLRPMEMLPNENIVLTTANPRNRYIRMQSDFVNRNTRDMYIRALTLGGQQERLNEESAAYELDDGFHSAWKCKPDCTLSASSEYHDCLHTG